VDSTSPSARVASEEDMDGLLEDIEVHTPALVLGEQVEGDVYLIHFDCPRCHARLTTAGVGFVKFFCSACADRRGLDIEMRRRFEGMTDE